MKQYFKTVLISFSLVVFSSCTTRGEPLAMQTPAFSDAGYTKVGSENGRDIYVARGVSNIGPQQISSVMNGTDQTYVLLKADSKNTFLLKEKNPLLENNVVVVVGSSTSPALVGSSLSQENNSVLIQESESYYAKEVTLKDKNSQYAH